MTFMPCHRDCSRVTACIGHAPVQVCACAPSARVPQGHEPARMCACTPEQGPCNATPAQQGAGIRMSLLGSNLFPHRAVTKGNKRNCAKERKRASVTVANIYSYRPRVNISFHPGPNVKSSVQSVLFQPEPWSPCPHYSSASARFIFSRSF